VEEGSGRAQSDYHMSPEAQSAARYMVQHNWLRDGVAEEQAAAVIDRELVALREDLAKARTRADEKCAIAAEVLEVGAKISAENGVLRRERNDLRQQISDAKDAFDRIRALAGADDTVPRAAEDIVAERINLLTAERDEWRRVVGNTREHRHVDASPDAGLPARILEAYIEEGEMVSEPPELAAMMNGWQSERNAILRAALARLGALEDLP
jgi:hypothetical protein